MTQETQPTITVNGVKYNIDELTQEEKDIISIHERLKLDFQLEKIKVDKALMQLANELSFKISNRKKMEAKVMREPTPEPESEVKQQKKKVVVPKKKGKADKK